MGRGRSRNWNRGKKRKRRRRRREIEALPGVRSGLINSLGAKGENRELMSKIPASSSSSSSSIHFSFLFHLLFLPCRLFPLSPPFHQHQFYHPHPPSSVIISPIAHRPFCSAPLTIAVYICYLPFSLFPCALPLSLWLPIMVSTAFVFSLLFLCSFP